MFDDQAEFDARFEWGEAGVRRLAPGADVVVIVDVLSFATAVDIAVGRGATIFPYRWRDESAVAFAQSVGAMLALPGLDVQDPSAGFSLSPASVQTIPPGTRLVLPSANGATLTVLAAESGATVLSGCLRNAKAVATACRRLGKTVAVIAAGERWVDAGTPTETLRPAVEDLIGAGAILAALGATNPSPEAEVAMAAFNAAAPALDRFISTCASGKELLLRGFASAVELAVAVDSSSTVPRLVDGAFTAWTA